MEKLVSGSKVTRDPWKDGVYFVIEDGDVKSYQPRVSPYLYNEDIMVSDGWIVDDSEQEIRFCDIIEPLRNGSKAKLKGWVYSFIFLDGKDLYIRTMENIPYHIDFDSFYAEDWIEI